MVNRFLSLYNTNGRASEMVIVLLTQKFNYPVSRGKLLLEWRRTHRFCGSCGSETVLSGVEHVQKCPDCGESWYPRTAPAVIVRITRDNRILLAHNAHFPEGLFSHVAGFVDPGETLEQAIHREVLEEVGLRVQNIKFFGSQSWPMPHSLMLGFTAEAIDDSEPIPDGEGNYRGPLVYSRDTSGYPRTGKYCRKDAFRLSL